MLQAAYTFDAGPNACIFTLPENASEVLSLLKYYFYIESDKGQNEIEYALLKSAAMTHSLLTTDILLVNISD
jgi:mevalonate pyrophosphate decarboxylase